jgi:hypothetical protein
MEPGCGVALVADDEVGVDAVCVKGVGALEDAAVRRAMITGKLAPRMHPPRQRGRGRRL